MTKTMRVLITGANGFVGKNLLLCLGERKEVQVVCFTRANNLEQLPELLDGVDCVFHLAGVNRTLDLQEFTTGNVGLTQALYAAAERVAQASGRRVSIVYASSTQAELSNPYGRSKRDAEVVLHAAARRSLVDVHIFRLPNVFGKWCKPNYNSAVATFCHNVARDLPIQVNDDAAPISLVYVDDVIERFLQVMDRGACCNSSETAVDSDTIFDTVEPQYSTTVGDLARQIQAFKNSRITLVTEPVGKGFVRALHATYVSYLPVDSFAYEVPQHGDPRGVFVEMLKTSDSGQFSYFTAHPGVTRGGHYHHSKTEKFLVIKGHARFRFRHMQTGQTHELVTSGNRSEVVETVPGWTHDITNIGSDEMIVMLWANEIFDRERPDTYACPL